jgi:type IV secretory pathway VirB10-like protein
MSSRVLAGLLVAGCLTAAGAGAYVAVRQNAVASAAPAQPTATAVPVATDPAAKPVSETEALVANPPQPQPSAPVAAPAAAPAATVAPAPAPARTETRRTTSTPARRETTAPTPSTRREQPVVAAPPVATSAPAERQGPVTAAPQQQPEPTVEAARAPELPPAPPVPQFEEVVLPTASVIGLQVDTALSSERARVEDRVEARVTRDVMADGRIAIPAGARVLGSVTTVERGGKLKDRARLGVRFHTLVLADGSEVPLRTETIYREGDSPSSESARKIGGAAVGGAILGAILGGGKGAAIGASTGAAGGTAVVMAGDRNAATLAPGTVVTVRLSAPATLEVEKRKE